MSNLTELIERIEAAEGPSDQLDAEIEVLLQKPKWPDAAVVKLGKVPSAAALKTKGKRGWRAYGMFFQHHRYSASIDAAMTLVPEDAFWRMGHDGDGADPSLFRAHVIVPRLGGTDGQGKSIGTTPALALCAAALKARAA